MKTKEVQMYLKQTVFWAHLLGKEEGSSLPPTAGSK